MKLITLLINNRIDHVLDFEPRKKSPDSYIVENTGGDINLFMFYRDSERSSSSELICQTNKGKKRVQLVGVSMHRNDGEATEGQIHDVNINICLAVVEGTDTTSRITGKLPPEESGYPADWTSEKDKSIWEEKNLKIRMTATPDFIYRVKVNFVIKEEDGNFGRGSFLINVVPQRYIWDVVLDYGSEASQMLIFNRGTQDQVTVNNIVPLFPMFKSKLGKEGVQDSDYLQYDPDDSGNFYKSSFFALKEPNKGNLDPCTAIDENGNIMLMTPVADLESIRQRYLPIPNIKVASHGGVRLPKIVDSNGIEREIFSYGDNYFYRSLVNSFLYQAMRYTCSDDNPAYLNICLLVPNVYTQSRITDNLVSVAKDIMTIAGKDNSEVSHVKGVEAAALSESDASFLGFMETRDSRTHVRKGRYLILDAGKGTLDFSVLEYNPDAKEQRHMYKSIFRSGIIGAGNAITYAVLLAVLDDILTVKYPMMDEGERKRNISDFIKDKIATPSADEAEICSILDSLEQYKRKYNAGELYKGDFPINVEEIHGLEDLRLTALNNIVACFIDKSYKVNNDSYILNMIDELANDVAVKIRSSYSRTLAQECKLDFVVFAGRGFQMEKLRRAVFNRIKAQNDDICSDMRIININRPDASSAKNICLFIRNHLTTGRYNGRLVGQPQLISYGEMNELESSVYSQDEIVETPKVSITFLHKVKQVLASVWEFLVDNLTGKGGLETINYLSSPDVGDLNRALVDGFRLNISSHADQVVFSGVSYPVPQNISTGSCEVLFTGSEFVFRQRGNIGYLSVPTNLDCQHVFESSFPFAELSQREMVPFPKNIRENVNNDTENTQTPSGNVADYGHDDEAILKKFE